MATEAEARALDAADPLSAYRDRFLLPDGPEGPDGPPAIYLAGNSLGLQPRTVGPAMEALLERWARLGVEGWFEPDDPWFTYDETLREPMARIVGAKAPEVAILNTLTVNLHLMLVSFFRPDGARRKILTDAPIFPSDRHALTSHLAWRGLDPEADLVVVGPRSGEDTVRIEDLEGAIAELRPEPGARPLRWRQLRDRPGAAGRAADGGGARGRGDRRLGDGPCRRQPAADPP